MVFNVIKVGQKVPEVKLTSAQKALRYREVKNYVRSCREMGRWLVAVRARFNHTCQECGVTGVDEVHHIHGLKALIVENDLVTVEAALKCAAVWDVDNGVVLCHECHAKKHPENY